MASSTDSAATSPAQPRAPFAPMPPGEGAWSLPRVLVPVAPHWAPAPASMATGLHTGALGGWSTELGRLRQNISTGSGAGSLGYTSSFVIQIKGRIIMSHAFSNHSKYNFHSTQRLIGIGVSM